MKKRYLAAALCLSLSVFTISGCSAQSTAPASSESGTAAEGAASTAAADDKTAGNESITIEVWHTRGAGANGEMIADSVKEFNETNDKGITVVETYQGSYTDTLTKTMQAVSAGTQPAIVVMERAAGVPVMAEQDILADMTPYIEADGFDMKNFLPVLTGYSYYNDKIVSLPYIRSTPVFYYNKTMFDNAGYTKAPSSFEEAGEICKKLIAEGKAEQGFELLNDPAWFVQNMMYQLGSNMLSEDGNSAPCLKDGALLKVLSSWRGWVDEGWCAPFVSTDAESTMKEAFYQQKLACFIASSGGLSEVLENSKDFEVGVAQFPSLTDKMSAPTGGGNIGIIDRGNSDEVKAAAWEFVKFLMSDEQVAKNVERTGYLPTTYSAAKTDTLKNLWLKTPQYKVSYNQLETAQELPWSPYKADFEELLKEYCSYVIQDKTYTPEQAVAEITENAKIIFPR